MLDGALAAAGIDRSRITALASIDRKRDEPGLLALAQRLNLPLQCFSAERLADYEHRLSHRSTLAFAHTGCYGVAESAALALAEHLSNRHARLLITRQKSAQATPLHWPARAKIPIIAAFEHEPCSCSPVSEQDFSMTVYFIGAGPGDPEQSPSRASAADPQVAR